ncbi:DUF3389 domain-containing protein [Vibrio sp.]|nr:DUF3389 domain-containing protein [Vibrio sp.]
MSISFAQGKVIFNQHEVLVKLAPPSHIVLQANVDAVSLIGRGANVLCAHEHGVKWSVKLDNESQLIEISEGISVPIK